MSFDWDRLRIFYEVALTGSLTKGAGRLNLSQSAVSRQISHLEERVGVKLFHRHARGLLLTEQGETLYRTVREVFHMLTMAEANITENQDEPSGALSLTTPKAFGTAWLIPRIKKFRKQYPKIELNLIITDHELDLGMRQADAAIRMTPPTQGDLVQKPLCTITQGIYASKEYLKERGEPQFPSDLNNHDLIAFGEGPWPSESINWLQSLGVPDHTKRKPVLRINSLYGIKRAVISGQGIAGLPNYLFDEIDEAQRIMPQFSGPEIVAYFVYPEELRRGKRIAVLRDFLLEELKINNKRL